MTADPKWLAEAEELAGLISPTCIAQGYTRCEDCKPIQAAAVALALEEAHAEGLEACAYALTEAERALRAWTTPLTGMGSNITQEDRGRTGLALREIEKARACSRRRPSDA